MVVPDRIFRDRTEDRAKVRPPKFKIGKRAASLENQIEPLISEPAL
jgi:hypothetical protein